MISSAVTPLPRCGTPVSLRGDIAPATAAACDTSALTRNVELSKKYKITGTPTLVFADGSRVPGAISAAQLEKFLADAKP